MSARPLRPEPLSPEGRMASRAALATETLDLLVVGGGITGAGVARAAALRGLRVGLVERSDFGAGTSSRSSKIIHGGVRYLEHLQLGLVRESARERAALRRLAPHLVHPLPFLYPVYRGESLLKVRAGLRLFDLLAGAPRGERSRALSPEETRERLPGLRDPLRGAVLYPEYITDDARFTLENVLAAAHAGARVLSHAPVEAWLRREDRVAGAGVRDLEADETFEVRAEVVVNATGPWADVLAAWSGEEAGARIVPSKGIHILLPRTRLPLQAATFLRAPNGRRGLAMPRGPWVYVGTSDEVYEGNLAAPRARAAEVEELVAMTADCFPGAGIDARDVVATWAGIRPLIREEGKSTRDMSRRDELWTSPPGLVTVAGGKLTTYRPMARRILDAAGRARGRPIPALDHDEPPLPGAPAEPNEDFRDRTARALAGAGVPAETLERVRFLYGTQLDDLLAWGQGASDWLAPLHPSVPALRGEVRLAVREGARTLEDALDRRMALLLFAPSGGVAAAAAAADILGDALGWSPDRRRREETAYRELARQHGPLGEDTPAVDAPGPAR